MSPRTFVTRSAALFALAALGAACETKTIVQPPPTDVVVTVSPTQATLNKVGQQVQFVAQVTGVGTNGNTGVTWKSSNTAVATVAASGNTATVTAVANGVTSIIATSAQDANKQSAATVTVKIDSGAVVVPPTVSINSITDLAGTPANVNAITGPINVVLNVDVPPGNNVSAVNWLLDGKAFCTQTFTAGKSADATVQAASAVTMSCQVNTAAVDAAGKPLYANGAHTLSASLVSPTGTVLASTTQQLTFANVNAIGVTASGAKTATDAGGLLWNGGDLTVKITPSVFDTQVLQTVSVTVADAVNALSVTKTVTMTGNAAATVVFSATDDLAGFEDAATTVTVNGGVTTAGQNFNGTLGTATLRYDDKAPVITAGPVLTTTNNFFNAAQTFSSACTLAAGTFTCDQGVTATDGGVDKVSATFQTAPAPGTQSGVVFTAATTSIQIGNQAANSLVAREVVCDALGNCANSPLSAAFGVDIAPPFMSTVGTPTNVNATIPTINIVAQDTGAVASGFAAGFVKVTIIKDSASSTGADVSKCVDPNTGALSSIPTGGCPSTAVTAAIPGAGTFPFVIPTPNSGGNNFPDGYYTVTVTSQDLAGNVATSVQRIFLVDAIAPTVTITGINTTVTPPVVVGTAHDNVDMASYDARQQFTGLDATIGVAGVTSLPFTAPVVVKGFGLPLTGNVALNIAQTLVKGVQAGLGSATVYTLTGLGAGARDQAGLYAEGFQAYTQASTGVTATDIASLTTAASAATVCKSAGCTTNPTSTTLSATVLFNANTTTANPITAVFFYAVDNTGHAVLIGTTNAFTLTIPSTTNQRTFTYTLAATAASTFTITGANTVFAVGVDANGNAVLMGAPITVTTL